MTRIRSAALFHGHADAQGWAIVGALPAWVTERYHDLVVAALDQAREGDDLS